MPSEKLSVAILGPGNIGTDLMYKLLRSQNLQLAMMVGVVPESDGLTRAAELGIETSADGLDAILARPDIDLVFDATGAKHHLRHAPKLKAAGKIAIDLTPAAVGPYVVPAVNMGDHFNSPNINLITCGGQATIPIVAAVSRAAPVKYAEMVATISSKSAGPGTRQNIDEFTVTTANGLRVVGGARESKALIVLNPAEPPILMRNTVYCLIDGDFDRQPVLDSIQSMVKVVQGYVPGYRLRMPPMVDGERVTVMLEVEGAGEYLPTYAGNLDIMTAAAVGVAERLAERKLKEGDAAHA